MNFWLGVGWVGWYSAEIFIRDWVVQMPTLTEENSQFLQSGFQEVQCNAVPTCRVYTQIEPYQELKI